MVYCLRLGFKIEGSGFMVIGSGYRKDEGSRTILRF
jgi:hypothetical protein